MEPIFYGLRPVDDEEILQSAGAGGMMRSSSNGRKKNLISDSLHQRLG